MSTAAEKPEPGTSAASDQVQAADELIQVDDDLDRQDRAFMTDGGGAVG